MAPSPRASSGLLVRKRRPSREQRTDEVIDHLGARLCERFVVLEESGHHLIGGVGAKSANGGTSAHTARS